MRKIAFFTILLSTILSFGLTRFASADSQLEESSTEEKRPTPKKPEEEKRPPLAILPILPDTKFSKEEEKKSGNIDDPVKNGNIITEAKNKSFV
jgi:hypothetical protein